MMTTKPNHVRETVLSACMSLAIVVATLAVLEVVLRIANFKELRETLTEQSLSYGYDPELGWTPVPNSSGQIVTFRTTHYKHNSLGLPDEEFGLNAKPTIMFLGDSFVWGLDSEADERFTELLKPKLPDYNVLAAGVAGFGTDQEYLLLKRLWPKVKPAVVVLIFAQIMTGWIIALTSVTSIITSPILPQPNESIVLMGEPVPKSHLLYYKDHWLVHNFWLARLVTDAYVRLRYLQVTVTDPTEKLVGKIREFVEGNGSKFIVGIQNHDDALASYLEVNRIPFARLEGAAFYTEGGWGPHWRPEGHLFVAERILRLLSQIGIGSRDAAIHGN